jgi:hypothetical protein
MMGFGAIAETALAEIPLEIPAVPSTASLVFNYLVKLFVTATVDLVSP